MEDVSVVSSSLLPCHYGYCHVTMVTAMSTALLASTDIDSVSLLLFIQGLLIGPPPLFSVFPPLFILFCFNTFTPTFTPVLFFVLFLAFLTVVGVIPLLTPLPLSILPLPKVLTVVYEILTNERQSITVNYKQSQISQDLYKSYTSIGTERK
ncbi:hypothetical protein BDF14DRAFT_1337898 [Spinellus fusiger]|nr:hypothetical protein BDF14DRAFT_1337898 [Spinellus fusiger]